MASSLTQLKYDDDIEYSFTDTFDMNELKCIEIEGDMVDDLENGKLEIRGDLADETVLVTSNKSYKIRQHDSSNTILITSSNNTNNESIYSAISCIYILEEQPPRLNKLHEILYQRPYKGIPTPEVSPDIECNKINKIDLSFDGLKLLVQCSDNELLEGLDEINAIEINNEWRIIDENYLFSCFQDILLVVMEHSIDFNKFKSIDIIENMNDFPSEIINHCIKINSISRKNDENGYWKMDKNKVCIFWAKQILKQNGNKMKESEFMESWHDNLPYGIIPNKSMLIGHCMPIWNKIDNENIWYIFEEKQLSLEPKDRFKQLFQKKNEWTLQEIEPYLLSLVKSGHSVDKLLLRHTRMIRTKDNIGNEKRIYISRRVKRN